MKRERRVPMPEPLDFNNHHEDEIINRQYTFELITPMFGGDVKSWELDLKNPVRSSSVKGRLRFWWRTMQNESNPECLLAKENKLWGGKTRDDRGETTLKSPVRIAVVKQNNIKYKPANSNAKIIPDYVKFPIAQKIKNNEDVYLIEQLTFTLQLSFPQKYEDEVMNTLTLWTLFGGVGARTRRGTGSLYCAELLKKFKDKKDIQQWLDNIAVGTAQKLNYPRITGAQWFVKEEDNNAQSAWYSLLSDYGLYRQDRREGNSRPGRSYWPEPDTIRAITGDRAYTHKPVDNEQWFPRAAFGLPILTKFSTKGDPGANQPISLEPEDKEDKNGKDRYPSPVILKAIRLPGNKVLTCCPVLNQCFPEHLKLKTNTQTYSLDNTYMPFAPENRQKAIKTKTDDYRSNNESIYQHLARHLKLEAVK